jgi:hypothetical protein
MQPLRLDRTTPRQERAQRVPAPVRHPETLVNRITLSTRVIAPVILCDLLAGCATSAAHARSRHGREMTGLPPPRRASSVRKREFAPVRRR